MNLFNKHVLLFDKLGRFIGYLTWFFGL